MLFLDFDVIPRWNVKEERKHLVVQISVRISWVRKYDFETRGRFRAWYLRLLLCWRVSVSRRNALLGNWKTFFMNKDSNVVCETSDVTLEKTDSIPYLPNQNFFFTEIYCWRTTKIQRESFIVGRDVERRPQSWKECRIACSTLSDTRSEKDDLKLSTHVRRDDATEHDIGHWRAYHVHISQFLNLRFFFFHLNVGSWKL